MITLAILFPLFAHAHAPLDCRIRLGDVPVVTRWLIEDGVLQPTAQLERLLEEFTRPRERELVDDVKDAIGPAAKVIPRVGDMIRVGRQLRQMSLGFKALRYKCQRVAKTIALKPLVFEQTMARSQFALDGFRDYVMAEPARDTRWVLEQIGRVEEQIARFRGECFEAPPPPTKSWGDLLKAVPWGALFRWGGSSP